MLTWQSPFQEVRKQKSICAPSFRHLNASIVFTIFYIMKKKKKKSIASGIYVVVVLQLSTFDANNLASKEHAKNLAKYYLSGSEPCTLGFV